VATVVPGRILGHEGTGVIEAVGSAVTAFRPNDRVLISCISACLKCEYCRRGRPASTSLGSWRDEDNASP
jgi:alcohol dehydrogenase